MELQLFRAPNACGWRLRDHAPALSSSSVEQFAEPFAEGGSLALVYRVAEEHGGRVDVEPLEDGNRITLTLPAPEQP
jgi:nitrogen fixation/metabolism regulation signal transduction histidine kinase